MAYNHNISVKVCGNPESSGGFGPILLLNNPSFVVEDQFYVGFDKNSFFFTITTNPTQTVYKLVKNNVRSSGASRIGSLVIAISIPKNYKLEGGYTPYDVLCALKDEFLKKCMTCKDPVRETYEYNAGKIDGHVLDEVVGKFTLTRFRTPDRVMTPNGPVGYIVETEEKIKELFQDVNYPEFDKFKEVVVATAVHTTSYVPICNIQIPRPKKYGLIVDGQPKGDCCNLNERLKIICRSKSPLYYEDLSFVFSIQDLIDGNVSHEGVVLDTVQERVSVETESWGTPKKEKVSLAIFPEEDEDYFISYPQELKVTLFSSNSRTSKRVDVSQQGLVITLEGNEIAALKDDGIQVDTTPRSKYVVEKQEFVEDILRVEVAQRKRPNPAPAGKLTVHVTFPEDKDLRGISSVALQAKNWIDHKEELSLKSVPLKRGTHSKSHKGSFIIEAKDIPLFDFYLTCSIKNEVWKTGKIKPNQKSVTVTFDKIHRPFTDRYKKPLVCVLATMMALILGGLSFVLYNTLRNENEQETALQEVFTRQDAYNFMNNVGQKLSEKQLAFDMVDNLYNEYETHMDTIKKYAPNGFWDYLCDYKKVTDFVRKGDIDSIKMVVDPKNKYKLYNMHLVVLKLIVETKRNEEIFRSKFSGLKCFDDIAKLYDVEKESNSDTTSIKSTSKTGSSLGARPAFGQVVCNDCRLRFNTYRELVNHQNCACKNNKYKCEKCYLRFKTEKERKDHYQRHRKKASHNSLKGSASITDDLDFLQN